MSDIGLKGSTSTWETPTSKPLDEAVWQAWQAKGRAQERRGRETRIKALKWGSILVLLAVAGLWSQLTTYDILIRCVLAATAAGMMFEAFNKRQYAFVAVFAAIALLYNPVAPVFSFAGNWQRALIIATVIPFLTSLGWRDLKAAHID